MHLNARSLSGNFDKFEILLANLRKSFSVIGVTETWLNDLTSDLVNIPGYTALSPTIVNPNSRRNRPLFEK
jgi:hypothetical protein